MTFEFWTNPGMCRDIRVEERLEAAETQQRPWEASEPGPAYQGAWGQIMGSQEAGTGAVGWVQAREDDVRVAANLFGHGLG